MTTPHLPGATCPQISTVQLCLRTVRREMGEALNLASCEALDRADAELDSLREANAALRVAAEGRVWQPIETAPNEVTVTMPLNLTPAMLRAVREDPTTSVEGWEEWHTRLGWLLCAWDVLLKARPDAPNAHTGR